LTIGAPGLIPGAHRSPVSQVTGIMLRYIGRRLLIAIPTLLIVSVLVFALQQLLPGDPVLTMAGEERDPAVLEFLREKYRLNDPVPVQYVVWLGEVLRGNLGISLRTDIPVLELVLSKLPVTIELAILAMIVALLIGIPAGIISAVRKGTTVDYAANVVALSGLSIPNFWLGIMLIMLVSVRWQLLPASGYVPPTEDLWLNIKTMIMPSIVLGTGLAGSLMRHTRSAMLGVLRSDYIRTAKAKGLLSRAVILKHALRNALIPIVTLSTLLFGELLAGAVLTEQIFTIPGFGKLVVDAVFNRDYAVVQGVVLCTAVGFIAMNLLADVLYVLVNPRLRHAA
jgi:peptide/nickel transport system permease protein